MRFFLLIISLTSVAFSYSNISLFEKQRISGVITSNTSDDIVSSKEYYSLRHYIDTRDALYLVGFIYQPLQNVGNTSLYSLPVEIKQKREKIELGAAYKIYLMDTLYIAPAIVYSHTDTTTYQELNNNGSITTNITEGVDTDYSLYALMGYRATQTTSILTSLELKNDLLSSDYSKDYSSFQLNISMLQSVSRNVLLYFQYNRYLKDKPSTDVHTGVKDVEGFSLGLGYRF